MSESSDPVAAPRDRETALSAAYLRLLDHTQVDAARATGVDPRTLGRWESCSWWPEIVREASDRWLAGLAGKSRKGLEAGVLEDGRLALSVLERLDERLRPLPNRQEITGAEGGPIQVEDLSSEEVQKRKAHLANRIAALQQSTNGKRNGAG